MKKNLLLLCITLLTAGVANAAVTTYIDFTDVNGTTTDAGWNMVELFTAAIPPVGSGSTTLTADDSSTDLSIGNVQIVNAERGFHSSEGAGSPTLPSWLSSYDTVAARDHNWMIDDNDAIPMTLDFDLSGFTTGDKVNISVWAGNYDNGSDFMDMTIEGGFSDGNVSDDFNWGVNGNSTSTTLNWTDLTVPGDGVLSVNLTSLASSNRMGLNAMQIEVIPEPSSLILMGVFGLAGFAFLRRRK